MHFLGSVVLMLCQLCRGFPAPVDTIIIQVQQWGEVGAQHVVRQVLLNGESLTDTSQEVNNIIQIISADSLLPAPFSDNQTSVLRNHTVLRSRECILEGSQLHWADRVFYDGKVYLTLDHSGMWTVHIPQALTSQKLWGQEHTRIERIHLQEGCIKLMKELKLSEEQSGIPLSQVLIPIFALLALTGLMIISLLLAKNNGLRHPGGVVGSIIHYPKDMTEMAPEIKGSGYSTLKLGCISTCALSLLHFSKRRSSEKLRQMAHFGLENDIHGILKLDMPITNGPMARWQRKASSSNGLSPGKCSNVSLSSSKTPSKTPGKGKRQTPSKMGGDRFIPIRNSKQMDVASFLLTKENQPADANETAMSSENQKAWSLSLNGYNIEDAKILHFGGKPLNAPEGYQNNLKVLYSQVATPASIKKNRYISSAPDKVLDAPELRNDFYLNLLDWSSQNVLAVALHNSVYLWDATQGDITLLMKMEGDEDYICSLSWTREGSHLAVGTSDGVVQLWDVENQKRLRSMASHTARVGTLSWNEHILSSGSRSGQIHHHDVRKANHHIFTLNGHSQEVCGLKWSPDGRYLASGGNDNLVFIWPSVSEGGSRNSSQSVHSWSEHQGAVKALAWCPWQPSILASGGGTSDRHIRIWNVNSGSCISSLDTRSQISSLVFAPNYKELVSAHGYDQNNIVISKFPSLSKVAELNGHEDRVLNLTLSPDNSTIASVAGDETIRLWKCFDVDPLKKKAKERMQSSSSVLHPSIR
ncbi:hypothetical protein Q5P01_022472 [Channa striata]|uniref:CDC20/Fizzy WD40 domain-containing protein n=1 Tax=Channa striata TaxID=64152 RepID=A0AA88JCV5_CHASR|nr:hypothetical protein Q5P01_022472 [Channa striata]